jgi:hypothetical protein
MRRASPGAHQGTLFRKTRRTNYDDQISKQTGALGFNLCPLDDTLLFCSIGALWRPCRAERSRVGGDRSRGDTAVGWQSGGPIDAWWHAEQRAAALERSSAAAVGEEAEVADADQAFGKDMDQKAAQELIGGNGHDTEKCYKNGVFSNFDLANLGQTQSPAI